MLRVTIQTSDGLSPRVRVARDADWSENEHSRSAGGQFSAGGSVHVVASVHPMSGNVTVHGVHAERSDAVKHQLETLAQQHKKLGEKHEGSDVAEGVNALKAQQTLAKHNAPGARTKSAEVSGSGAGKDLHLVVEGDHSGGVKVHGAHLTAEAAQAHAERVSKEAWREKGDTRSEVSEREWFNAAKEFNSGKPKADRVTIEQMENNSHPEFEKFLSELHPMDKTLPHPGVAKANKYFVQNHLSYGTGFNTGRTGVIRVAHHKG